MQASIKFIFKLFNISLLAFFCAAVCGCGEKTPAQIEKEKREKIELSVKRARVLLFENNNEKAVELLESVSKECGVNADMCEILANAYAQNGKIGFAAIFFEKASDLKGGDAELQISAAKAYEQSGSFESAARAYEKYLKIRPQDSVMWKALANSLEKLNRYQEAMNAFMSAIRTAGRDPNSNEAAQIGLLFLKMSNTIQAKRWLDAAYAAAAPENKEVRTKVLIGLIQIDLAEKNQPKLEEHIAQLDKISPEQLDKNFPELRKQIDEFKKSLKEAQEALDLQKQKEEAEKKAAEEELKKKEEAAEAAKKAEQQAKEKAEQEAKEKAQAEKKITENKDGINVDEPKIEEVAIKDLKENPQVKEKTFVEKAYQNLEQQNFKGAEQNAHKAVAEDPDSFAAWTALSKTYEAEGKNNDSFLAAGEALNRNPEDIDANLYFLRTASKVQNNEQFLNSLYAARKKFPYNAEILIGLARTYKEMQDKKNSYFFYRTFLKEVVKEHPRYKEIEEEFNDYSSKK